MDKKAEETTPNPVNTILFAKLVKNFEDLIAQKKRRSAFLNPTRRYVYPQERLKNLLSDLKELIFI